MARWRHVDVRVAAVVCALSACTLLWAKDATVKLTVRAPGKTIKLVSKRALDVCHFSREGIPPVARSIERVKPGKDKTFLLVELETYFPPGPGLDLLPFLLREKDKEGRVMRRVRVSGFAAGGKPDGIGLVLYHAEHGVAGGFDNLKNIVTMDNPPGRPWQIHFAHMQDKKGKPIRWPGGKASVKLLYEVPKDAIRFVLVRSDVRAFDVKGLTRVEALDVCVATFLYMFDKASDWNRKVERRFISVGKKPPDLLLACFEDAKVPVRSPYVRDPTYSEGRFANGKYSPNYDSTLYYYVWMGSIRTVRDGRVIVKCGVTWGGLAARSYEYTLKKADGKWSVVNVKHTALS